MPVSERTLEIMAITQRSLKNGDVAEFHKLSLEELRNAHEDIGHRDSNADFRLRMINRIADLEKVADRKIERRWRIGDHVISFVAGVIATLITGALLKWLGLGG